MFTKEPKILDDWVEKSYATSTTGINGKHYVFKVSLAQYNPKKITKEMFHSNIKLILGAVLSSKAGASIGVSRKESL